MPVYQLDKPVKVDQACSPLKLHPIPTDENIVQPVSVRGKSRALEIKQKEAELQQIMSEITSLRMARSKQTGCESKPLIKIVFASPVKSSAVPRCSSRTIDNMMTYIENQDLTFHKTVEDATMQQKDQSSPSTPLKTQKLVSIH